MTISQELLKTILKNGVKKRTPITWETFSSLEPIDAETVAGFIETVLKGTACTRQKFQALTPTKMLLKSEVTENLNQLQEWVACTL